jgi:hypothetical protein
MKWRRIWITLLLCGVAIGSSGIAHYLTAQDAAPATPRSARQGRFEFEVVECFDAKYQGDTPGYIGRHGELGDFRPTAGLGDPIFRGEEKVGSVTRLTWSRAHGSLEIEFDPVDGVRTNVGDVVWLKLGGDGG